MANNNKIKKNNKPLKNKYIIQFDDSNTKKNEHAYKPKYENDKNEKQQSLIYNKKNKYITNFDALNSNKYITNFDTMQTGKDVTLINDNVSKTQTIKQNNDNNTDIKVIKLDACNTLINGIVLKKQKIKDNNYDNKNTKVMIEASETSETISSGTISVSSTQYTIKNGDTVEIAVNDGVLKESNKKVNNVDNNTNVKISALIKANNDESKNENELLSMHTLSHVSSSTVSISQSSSSSMDDINNVNDEPIDKRLVEMQNEIKKMSETIKKMTLTIKMVQQSIMGVYRQNNMILKIIKK